MSDLKYKCPQCKKYISIETEDFIYDQKSYHHKDCLFEYLTTKKRNKLNIQQANEYIKNLSVSSKEKGKYVITKHKFYKWLQEKYEMITLPVYFFQKTEEIFIGRWKDMTRPIPPEDLWDIWYRQWNYLEKQYRYNSSHGKEMDSFGRLNYDLAIILNKSNSYYEWKKSAEAEKINRKQSMVEEANSKISYNELNVTKQKDTNKVDIADILEEI